MMRDAVDQIQKLWAKCVDILARRSTMSSEEIQEKALHYDWFVYAYENFDLRFAYRIG